MTDRWIGRHTHTILLIAPRLVNYVTYRTFAALAEGWAPKKEMLRFTSASFRIG